MSSIRFVAQKCNSPCYLCVNREQGCHTGCAAYAEWRTEHDEFSKNINQKKAVLAEFADAGNRNKTRRMHKLNREGKL